MSHRPFVQCRTTVAAFCLLVGLASAVGAQTSTFTFLLDLNNDDNPGPPSPCTVTTAQGPFTYDYRADMTLNLAALPAGAQPLTWTACPGEPAVPATTWAFQLAQGPAGEDVFEATYPLNGFRGFIRLAAMSSSSTTPQTDAMVNPPILIQAAQVLDIPTLGQWGMLALAALLSILGLWVLRRKSARAAALGLCLLAAGVGLAWASHITIDGATGDWSGGPLATDLPPASPQNVEIVSLWAQAEDPNLYLRLDVDVAANQAPVAGDDAATVAEDAAATTVNVLANDADPDADPMTITAVTQPANGTVVITNGGADLTYQPDPDYCNTPPGTTLDTFTYTVSATGGTDTATVSMTVTCVDDAPTAVNDAATVAEDSGANTINVQANDTDPDGGTNTVSAVQNPSTAGGTVLITNGGADASYQPSAGYCNNPPGTTLDTFTYTLTPGGSVATVTVTVDCVDNAPTAVNDAATVAEDAAATTINVQANDTDPDGGTNTITAVQNPSTAGGTVLITNGGADLTYQPAANYCNTPPGTTLDTFTYTLSPGGSTATVTVTVNCVDDAPTAVNDTATVAEDAAATTINVQANDTDPDGGTNTITAVQNPSTAGGTVLITNAGADLTYQPAPNYCNTPPGTTLDTFTYTLSPGGSVATVTVTVTCTDDAPTAVNDTATVAEDAAATTINVQANDTDPDGGTNTISAVQNPSTAGGTVLITNAGADLTYQPASNYCNNPPGTTLDTFTYTLSPGGSVATVTVTVTCIDDNPVAVNDAATVNEDSGANTINVQANDTDVDGGPISITAVQNPSAQGGTVLITGGGTGLTYAPAANYCNNPPGTTLDTFTYTLSPGGSVATVTVTVTCIDDDPVAVNDAATVNEDSGANTINVQANDTDVDGGPISITAVQNPSAQGGTVLITNGGADLTYAPAPNYCNNPPGTTLDTFTYTLTPGGSVATVTVTVTCIDDPPVAVNDSATVDEDSGATAIPVLANDTDVDGGPISITAVQNPSTASGTVLITGGGTGLTYAPASNYCNNPPGTTPDTFTYTLSPGGSVATVSVTVNCVNDPPTVLNETFDVIGNTELRVDMVAGTTPHASETTPGASSYEGVLDNDGDPEGDTVSVTAIGNGCADLTAPFDCTLADGAVVHVDANGEFSYTPGPGDIVGSFTYTVTDQPGFGTPLSANGTVTFNFFERVWYVDNSFGGVGNGTSIAPFDALTSLNGAGGAGDSDSPNDYIFVYFGDGTSSGQDAGLVLENGQHLLGEHAGLSIPVNLNGNGSPTVLHAGTPGSRPFIDNSGSGVNAVSATDVIPVEIVGLSLTGSTNAIDWTTTGAFAGAGSFSIRDNVVTAAGQEGVDVNLAGTGAVNLAFHDNNLTATGTALDVQETGTGSLTITAFHDNVVPGTSAGAGLLVNTATFDATPGGPINPVPGGTTVIGAPGNGIGGPGLSLSNVTGALNFANLAAGTIGAGDLDVFTDSGAALTVAGVGGFDFDVTANAGVLEANAGPAAVLSGTDVDLQLNSLTSTNSAATGVSLTSVTGTFLAPSGSSITNAGTTDFVIATSSAAVTYGGTITDDVGQLVSVSGSGGSLKSFTGAITDGDDGDGSGISLTGNSTTIRFSGGVVLSTGGNPAFTATGGGTVEVCDENPCNPAATGLTLNKLTTTTGTALNVAGTIIGANRLEFRSISAGTGASGPTNGIVLNNTGALGGLTVTGTGSAGSGGTIQRATGPGISLTSATSVNLASMNVQNGTDDGVNATSVSGLTLASMSVTNNGDSTTDEGIELIGVSGNVSITNATVTGNAHNNLFLDNNNASPLSSFTITGGSFSSNSAGNGNHGILFQARGTSTVTSASVSGVTVQNNKSIGMQVIATDTATISDFTVSGSTFTDTGTGNSQEIAIDFSTSQTGNLTCKILNNTNITNHNSHAINLATAAGAGTGGVYNCRVVGNTIGNAGIASSGSAIGNCLRVNINGGADATILIDGNTLRQCPNGRGMEIVGRNGTGGLDVTVTNNDVNPQALANPLAAILVQSNAATVGNTVRSDVRGNTVPNGNTSTDLLSAYLILVETGASTLQLIDTAPASPSCAQQLNSTNTGSTDASAGCALIAGPINTPP